MYELRGNAVVKIRKFTNRISRKLDHAYVLRISRDEAHRLRRAYIKQRGYSVLDRNLKKRIKEYCRKKFGSSGYWPWIALYTEYRGEFKEGWIPCDYFRFSVLPRWNPHTSFSSLKTMDYRFFKGFSVNPVATVINSVFYDTNQNIIDSGNLEEHFGTGDEEFVIKNDGGKGGKNVQFVKKEEIKHLDLSTISDVVIQPVVKQHEVLNRLHNQSVNTVRVATFMEAGGRAVSKFIVLRVGTGESRVDNTSSGGVFLMLDLDGNTITEAFDDCCTPAGHTHPDSGVEYKRLKIPGVRKASEACCKAHEKFPYVRFVAWDICIEENGEPVLLEWNSKNPGMWFEEAMIGPLWKQREILR